MAAHPRNTRLLLRFAWRLAEARSCIELMREMESPSGDALGPLRLRNPHWANEMAHLLKKADWQQ
jgi:hypothetical protein